eukprot:UN18893
MYFPGYLHYLDLPLLFLSMPIIVVHHGRSWGIYSNASDWLGKFNKSSIIYFIVTSCSRVGIAVGVILRMTLGNGSDGGRGQQGQQIGFIT